MTWPCHHDFEIFSEYLDIHENIFCPNVPSFSQLSLNSFSFSNRTTNQAFLMYYFHPKLKFFNAHGTLDSCNLLKFFIKSSCLTKIYNVTIKFPFQRFSISDYVKEIEYACTCKHYIYFPKSNSISKHCKHIIYCLINLINC